MAVVYDEPRLLAIVPAIGLCSIFAGFNSMSLFTRNRRLHLRKLTFANLLSYAISVIVMIVMAWLTRSIWSLVVGAWVGSIWPRTAS